ncbi:MAG: cell division protein FtsQ/DivIB [Halofilum sp. (in: g-proteobacteria)]|nr:cell division protein FtsQ/DivIB [Halofilum sp. (in: g-proteobacteria)]
MSAAAMSIDSGSSTQGRALGPIAGVLAAALVGAGGAWWWHDAHWPVDVVRIEGVVAHVDRGALKQVVAAHSRDGFLRMDLGDLRADLVALPWVRDASLRRVWPDTLYVDVREHAAAASWNGAALVSEAGVVFEPASVEVDGLPALRGPEGHGPAMLERLRAFRERLAPLGLEIAALEQDARRAWRVVLGNGVGVRLGRDQVDARLERFAAVWPGVLAPRVDRIAAVDLRYPNGFAVAWEGEPPAADPNAAREGGA